MYTCMREFLVCDITVHTFFSLYRLFANFTMETVIAAAFGQRVEVQQGESSVLVKAASEFLCSFQDNGGLSLAEFSMLLCMLH